MSKMRPDTGEAWLTNVFDIAPIGMVLASLEGRWFRVNKALCELLGYSVAELAGSYCADHLHPDHDGDADGMLAELGRCPLVRCERKWLRKNGDVLWTDFVATLHRDPGDGAPAYVIAQMLDITEHKRQEERRRQEQRMEAFGQLAGGFAHDFNNLLNGMVGYADLLRDEVTEDPRLFRFADLIIQTGQRAAELTEQLLAFARRTRLSRAPVDVHDIIDDVAALIAPSLEPQTTLERTLEAPRSVVIGDRALLQTALLNLALNARDAVAGGPGVIRLQTRVTAPPGDAEVLEITVTDTGPGIAPQHLDRIFEPFFTTKPKGKGTGLGLAAVYGTITGHGGDIAADNAREGGAVLTVQLPLPADAA